TVAGARRKPSVSSRPKVRSAVERRPRSSTAVTEKRQRPSGAAEPSAFLPSQSKRYVPGPRAPLPASRVTPPGPTSVAVTVEGRTTLYTTVCRSSTASPFGERTATVGGGAYTPKYETRSASEIGSSPPGADGWSRSVPSKAIGV